MGVYWRWQTTGVFSEVVMKLSPGDGCTHLNLTHSNVPEADMERAKVRFLCVLSLHSCSCSFLHSFLPSLTPLLACKPVLLLRRAGAACSLTASRQCLDSVLHLQAWFELACARCCSAAFDAPVPAHLHSSSSSRNMLCHPPVHLCFFLC